MSKTYDILKFYTINNPYNGRIKYIYIYIYIYIY